jgi:mono/diheme cytochrome c family protein
VTERSWTVLITLAVLFVASLSIFHLGPTVLPDKTATGPAIMASGIPQVTPAMVPLVTGEEPTEELFRKGGCVVCHAIQGIKGAEGRVGPRLELAATGPLRLADPNYRGEARTVREYIIESILKPGAYVVPGFPDRAMPRWYGQKLSATALERIASYLEGVGGEVLPSAR